MIFEIVKFGKFLEFTNSTFLELSKFEIFEIVQTKNFGIFRNAKFFEFPKLKILFQIKSFTI